MRRKSINSLQRLKIIQLRNIQKMIKVTGLPNSILKSIESEKMLLNESNPLETILEISKKFFPLIKACRFGDIQAVNKMLDEGIDIHYNAEQPFSDAVINGHYDIADLLQNNGADVSACCQFIVRCLCDNNSIDGIDYLFSKDVEVATIGTDLLFTALDNKNFIIAKAILNHGIDVNAKNGILLQSACQNSNYEAIDFLLNNNADIHVGNESILLMASKKGDLKIVKHLISKGADIHNNVDDLLKMVCSNDNDDTDILFFLVNEKQIDVAPYKDSLLLAANLANNAKVLAFLQKLFEGDKKELH